MLRLTSLAFVAAVAVAHLCALQPLQRGGADGAGAPGAPACLQLTAPCGSAPSNGPASAYVAGQKTTVSLMKNLDHFNPKAPGNFSVYLWGGAQPVLLNSFADSSAPSLTVFQVAVTIPPTTASGNYTLQSIYYTDNSAAPAAFFQCSDVTVL